MSLVCPSGRLVVVPARSRRDARYAYPASMAVGPLREAWCSRALSSTSSAPDDGDLVGGRAPEVQGDIVEDDQKPRADDEQGKKELEGGLSKTTTSGSGATAMGIRTKMRMSQSSTTAYCWGRIDSHAIVDT